MTRVLEELKSLGIPGISTMFFFLGIIIGEISSLDFERLSGMTATISTASVLVLGWDIISNKDVGHRPIVLAAILFASAANLAYLVDTFDTNLVDIMYDMSTFVFIVLIWKVTNFRGCIKPCLLNCEARRHYENKLAKQTSI